MKIPLPHNNQNLQNKERIIESARKKGQVAIKADPSELYLISHLRLWKPEVPGQKSYIPWDHRRQPRLLYAADLSISTETKSTPSYYCSCTLLPTWLSGPLSNYQLVNETVTQAREGKLELLILNSAHISLLYHSSQHKSLRSSFLKRLPIRRKALGLILLKNGTISTIMHCVSVPPHFHKILSNVKLFSKPWETERGTERKKLSSLHTHAWGGGVRGACLDGCVCTHCEVWGKRDYYP